MTTNTCLDNEFYLTYPEPAGWWQERYGVSEEPEYADGFNDDDGLPPWETR